MIVALAVVTVITYANSLGNSFHYDDFHGIVRNPTIKDSKNVPRYFVDPSTIGLSLRNDWRPILQTTYALNFLVGGFDATNFRIFNLLVHIASAILILLIVGEIENSLRAPPSVSRSAPSESGLIAALLFALHPANSEVVNYIWARSSLLAAFFYLSAFYCFLRVPPNHRYPTTTWWQIGGICFYVLGLATKATAVTLPATLLLYQYLRSQSPILQQDMVPRWTLAQTKKLIPVTAICTVYIVLRVIFLPDPDSFARTADNQDISGTIYLLSSFRAWVYYLALFIWPSPLLVDTSGFGWSISLLDGHVLVSIAIVMIVIGGSWTMRRSYFILTFFIFWYFIALLPEQSFVPLSEPINGYRPYLAYAGLSIVISEVTRKGILGLANFAGQHSNRTVLRHRHLIYICVMASLMIVLATWTARRNLDWRNEFTLWSDVLRKDPNNAKAYMSLALYRIERGEYAEAEAMLKRAIEIAPANSYTYLLQGYFYRLRDQDDMALQDLTKAVELNPRSPYNFYYRAELLANSGKLTDAIADYERALALRDYFTDARFGLAVVYLQQQRLKEATDACEHILQIDRRDVRAYKCLGRILMERKDFAEASKVYERGLAYLPANKELWHDLSLTYVARGMLGPASVAYQKSTSVSPGSPN